MGNTISKSSIERVNISSSDNITQQCKPNENIWDNNAGVSSEHAGMRVAYKLFDSISGLTFSSIKDAILEIAPDNVTTSLKYYKNYAKESLVESICDEWSLNKTKKQYIISIHECLKNKALSYGLDTTDLDKKFKTVFEDMFSDFASWFGYIDNSKIAKIDSVLDEYASRIEEAPIYGRGIFKNKPLKPTLSKEEIKERLNSALDEFSGSCHYLKNSQAVFEPIEKIAKTKYELDELDLLGNGKFDYPSVQRTGNCAPHAAVNALLSSPKGKEYLSRLILKQGPATAIYLPGAEGKDYFSDDYYYKDGVFVCDETASWRLAFEHSLGDMDTAFLMRAMSACYNDTYGTMPEKCFEILSGQDTQIYEFNQEIPQGAGLSILNKDNYNKLIKMYANDEGVAYVDLREEIQKGNAVVVSDIENDVVIDKEPYLVNEHAYAIIKITEDNVYLKESNNPKYYIKMPTDEFIASSFRVSTLKF